MQDIDGGQRAPEAVLAEYGVEYFLARAGHGQKVMHLPSADVPSETRCQDTHPDSCEFVRRDPSQVYPTARLCKPCVDGRERPDGMGIPHPSIRVLEEMDPDDLPRAGQD